MEFSLRIYDGRAGNCMGEHSSARSDLLGPFAIRDIDHQLSLTNPVPLAGTV
jgi:hypothetical protein